MISKKHEKAFTALNCMVILVSVVTVYFLTIDFAPLVDIAGGITSSAVGL